MATDVLCAQNLIKSYPNTGTVLHGVDLKIGAGQCMAIVGRSGSGKSTLLNILAGLDQPDTGQVDILGTSLRALSVDARSNLRNTSIGFIFQFHHLLMEFTALENIAMPLLLRGLSLSAVEEQARAWLKRVGLSDREGHFPYQLSGGERQRLAIARALITEPKLVIADEPTGNLDDDNKEIVASCLFDLCATQGVALILVTHDMELAHRCGAIYVLDHGHLTRSS